MTRHPWHEDDYASTGHEPRDEQETEPTPLELASRNEPQTTMQPQSQGSPFNVDDYTVEDLRKAAKAAGLPQRGSKQELVDRLNG